MPVPISNDLRKRIVDYHNKGTKVEMISNNLLIPQRTIYTVIKRYKETGNYESLPYNGGRPPALTDEQMEEMRLLVRSKPDIELMTIKEKMSLDISIQAICVILNKKLGLVRKKKLAFR